MKGLDCQFAVVMFVRVKTGSGGASTLLLLCPNERTSRDAVTESVWCQKRK